MDGIFSEICNFNSGMNNTVSRIQEASFRILDRLNEIIVNSREEFINHTKQALLEMLSETGDKTKQDVLDAIEKFIYNLSNTAESVIERAKNATTDVLDESLGKIRHEADTFIEHIVTNRFFIIVSIFILITLF